MDAHIPEQQRPAGQGDFPYTITGGVDKPGQRFYRMFEYTPFVLEYLENLAKAAIEGESLGADQLTHLLAVSISTTDLIGHAYGPDSQEVLDAYIRLDRVLADFLTYLDRRGGPADTVIAVTTE